MTAERGGRVVLLAERRAQRAGTALVNMRAWIDGGELVIEFPADYERVRLGPHQIRTWIRNFESLLAQIEADRGQP